MLSYSLAVSSLVLLWFFSGLGVSYFLTRGTPLFRYFVGLAIFFTQILVVMVPTVFGTFEPVRVSGALVIFTHGSGILLSLYVIRKLGITRLWCFSRHNLTIPLLAVLVSCLVLQIAPCLDRGQPCYPSHLNDEYLNYSSNAQWLTGQAVGGKFETLWHSLGHYRFGAELMLAFVSRTMAIPPIYGISMLQAMQRFQYLICAVMLFQLLYTGSRRRRRWGSFAVAFALLLSGLEWQNYILAFLAHHSAASALAVLCATMLFRPSIALSRLHTILLIYLGITYIEIFPVICAILVVYGVCLSILERSSRPVLRVGAALFVALLSFYLRAPDVLPTAFQHLAPGANSGGFNMLGSPGAAPGAYLAGLFSLRSEVIGAVFTTRLWLQALILLAPIALLGYGLFLVGLRRRHYWILFIFAVVLAAHVDRGALLAGQFHLLEPVYQGPKAFLYFHFLWVAIIVSAGLSIEIPEVPQIVFPAFLGIWLIPLSITGIFYILESQAWPAVWSAYDDLALFSTIPRQGRLVMSSASARPGEEDLWRQLTAYNRSFVEFESAVEDKGGPAAAYIVANQEYSTGASGFAAKSLAGAPCPEILGSNPSFTLCSSVPASVASVFQLSGRMTNWDSPVQPLVSCGKVGAAVFLSIKKVDNENAVLTIDEWGVPAVVSQPFPFTLGTPFQIGARIDRIAQEVSLSSGTGAVARHKLASRNSLGSCRPIIGKNPMPGTHISRRFNGALDAAMSR